MFTNFFSHVRSVIIIYLSFLPLIIWKIACFTVKQPFKWHVERWHVERWTKMSPMHVTLKTGVSENKPQTQRKRMWFGCEQPFLWGERCVTSKKAAAKEADSCKLIPTWTRNRMITYTYFSSVWHMFPSSLYDTNHNTIALARPCNICSRYCIYHVKFTSYCESIERSRPIRFFIVRCIITLVICVWGYTYHGDTHITGIHISLWHLSAVPQLWRLDTWRLSAKYGTSLGLNGKKEVQQKHFWRISFTRFPAIALYRPRTFSFALFSGSLSPYCAVYWRRHSSR